MTDISDHLTTFVSTNLSAHYESIDRSNEYEWKTFIFSKNWGVWIGIMSRIMCVVHLMISTNLMLHLLENWPCFVINAFQNKNKKQTNKQKSMKYKPYSIALLLIKCTWRKKLLRKKSINKPTESEYSCTLLIGCPILKLKCCICIAD